MLAACMHPRSRLLWLNDYFVHVKPLPEYVTSVSEFRKGLVDEVTAEALALLRCNAATTSREENETLPVQPRVVDEDDEPGYYNFSSSEEESSSTRGDSDNTPEARLEKEVVNFLEKRIPRDGTINALDKLMDLTTPELKELYLKYNTKMPSSAPVERLFSHTKNVFTKLRTRLGSDRLNMQVVCSANQNNFNFK